MLDFERIIWPDLNAHYLDALKEGTTWILDNFNLSGIVASGTIIRGNPDMPSDFDVFVINDNNFRQRIQNFFKTVPFEIFVTVHSHLSIALFSLYFPGVGVGIGTGIVSFNHLRYFIYNSHSRVLMKPYLRNTTQSQFPCGTVTIDRVLLYLIGYS